MGQDEAFKGRCSIGCSGTLAWLLYSPLLDLQARYPGLSIELEATPNERIFEQVKQGTIDIGLVTKKPDPKYFSSQKIGAEHLAGRARMYEIDSSLNITQGFGCYSTP